MEADPISFQENRRESATIPTRVGKKKLEQKTIKELMGSLAFREAKRESLQHYSAPVSIPSLQKLWGSGKEKKQATVMAKFRFSSPRTQKEIYDQIFQKEPTMLEIIDVDDRECVYTKFTTTEKLQELHNLIQNKNSYAPSEWKKIVKGLNKTLLKTDEKEIFDSFRQLTYSDPSYSAVYRCLDFRTKLHLYRFFKGCKISYGKAEFYRYFAKELKKNPTGLVDIIINKEDRMGEEIFVDVCNHLPLPLLLANLHKFNESQFSYIEDLLAKKLTKSLDEIERKNATNQEKIYIDLYELLGNCQGYLGRHRLNKVAVDIARPFLNETLRREWEVKHELEKLLTAEKNPSDEKSKEILLQLLDMTNRIDVLLPELTDSLPPVLYRRHINFIYKYLVHKPESYVKVEPFCSKLLRMNGEATHKKDLQLLQIKLQRKIYLNDLYQLLQKNTEDSQKIPLYVFSMFVSTSELLAFLFKKWKKGSTREKIIILQFCSKWIVEASPVIFKQNNIALIQRMRKEGKASEEQDLVYAAIDLKTNLDSLFSYQTNCSLIKYGEEIAWNNFTSKKGPIKPFKQATAGEISHDLNSWIKQMYDQINEEVLLTLHRAIRKIPSSKKVLDKICRKMNKMTYFILENILGQDTNQQRLERLKLYLRTAKYLIMTGNLFGASALLQAISHPYLARLDPIMRKLPDNYQQIVDDLNYLFDANGNYLHLRKRLKLLEENCQANDPTNHQLKFIIPPLNLLMSELELAKNLKSVITNYHINTELALQYAKIIERFRRWQSLSTDTQRHFITDICWKISKDKRKICKIDTILREFSNIIKPSQRYSTQIDHAGSK